MSLNDSHRTKNGDSSPRVVMFYKLLRDAGGAELHFIRECEYLESQGVDVRVMTFGKNPHALYGYPSDQVEVIEGGFFAQLFRFRRRLREVSPDLIITSYGHLEVYLATRGIDLPYLFYHHSPLLLYSEEPRDFAYATIHRRVFGKIRSGPLGGRGLVPENFPYGWKRRLLVEVKARLDYRAVRGARLIVTYSRHTCEEIMSVYKMASIATRGGLDLEISEYRPRKDIKQLTGLVGRSVILNLNRLTVEKRVDVLIDAFKLLANNRPEALLLIGGIGPEKARLQAQVKRLGLADSVRFIGFVPDEDLWDYYAACDVFATPAWADFNIVPYVALSLGRKVVVSTEMEPWEGELESGRMFLADPSPIEFAEGLRRALESGAGTDPDLSDYYWNEKFSAAINLLTQLAEARAAKSRVEHQDSSPQ